jgi:hypothetical protein
VLAQSRTMSAIFLQESMAGMRSWLLAAILAAASMHFGSADTTAAAATLSAALQRPGDGEAAVEQGVGNKLTTGMSLVQVSSSSSLPRATAGCTSRSV